MKKGKMPAFLEKKKRDPKSMAPGKNTKGRSVSKVKTKMAMDMEQDRGTGRQAEMPMAMHVANSADVALAALTKPRRARARGF